MKKFLAIFSVFMVIILFAVFVRAAFRMPNLYLPELFSTFETLEFVSRADFSSSENVVATLPLVIEDIINFVITFVNALVPFSTP